MNDTKRKLIIICGYGLVGYEFRVNHEMQALNVYYQNVYNYLDRYIKGWFKENPLDKISVVFTGGFTNTYYTNRSEAQTARKYFLDNFILENTQLELWSRIDWLNFEIEEQSTNTHENISEAVKTGCYQYGVKIIGSKYRSLKLNLINKLFFGDCNDSIELIDHPVIKPKDTKLSFKFLSIAKMLKSPDFWYRKNQIPDHLMYMQFKDEPLWDPLERRY